MESKKEVGFSQKNVFGTIPIHSGNKMKKVIAVSTGEITTTKKDTILKSSAIGSCVVIAAYDTKERVGALAHVMVPGKAPEGKKHQKEIYAADAVEEMISRMILRGAKKENIEICIAGGANVLKRKDDTTGLDNITSVIEILKKEKIKIKVKSVGGTERRSISLDLESGSIYYSVGDGIEKLLWKAT
jgi:chemotaxis protein CheD